MQMTVLTPRICALVPHSTRPFWHQWESSTQQQQPQPEQQQEQPKKSARRRLFQQEDTADEETNKQYVKRLLNDLSERYKQKWNFDFENDKPMEGQYQYDALPARQVPGFYRMVQHFDQPQSPARPNFFGSATAEQQQQQPSAERNENHWSPLLEQQAGNSSGGDLGDQPMEAGESKLTASALKSPSRVLRKARRSMQTPNKRNGQQAEDRGRGSHGWPAERQTKLTDFMSTRKGLARSVSKEFKEPQQPMMAVADSPTKRRRHSTLDNGSRSPSRLFSVDSPIKKGGQTRRSPRLHHARSALFK